MRFFFLGRRVFVLLLALPARAAFAPDDALVPIPEPEATRCVTVAKKFGRADLQGLEDPHLMTWPAIERSTPFFAQAESVPDAEALWNETKPFGPHYLLSDIPAPELTPAQALQMKTAFANMRARQSGPAWMLNRVLIKMIETEGKFLKENPERIEGLRAARDRLVRENKKMDRQVAYAEEIALLEDQQVRLEESILAKYAHFLSSPLTNERDWPDKKDDLRALATAAYQAALHRARRLSIPHREITLHNGQKAIEFLNEGESDLAKLVKDVHRITKDGDTHFRAVFSPGSALDSRWLNGGTYLDELGNFGVSPEYLLFGKRDVLVTPLQKRMLQMFMMQKKGAATPFRGAVTQDDFAATNMTWMALYQQVVMGAYVRNVAKMFPKQTKEQKLQLARELHDSMSDTGTFMLMSGAEMVMRLSSRAVGRITDPTYRGASAFASKETLSLSLKAPDGQVAELFTILPHASGVSTLVLESRYVKFRVPLRGKDLEAPLAELLPLLQGNEQKIELTKSQREAFVRLIRAVQRSVDVAQNLKGSTTFSSTPLKTAARAYAENPSDENDANLQKALKEYKEPTLDRLSLRGAALGDNRDIVPEPPEIYLPPPGYKGPDTPDHLLHALKTGRGMGTGTDSYRKAVEQIGVEAVRAFLEQKGMDTRDRGPDQKGYDVLAKPRIAEVQEAYVEVKATSDATGIVSFTAPEIQFAYDHRQKGDWVLAIVVLDKDGKTTIHFRRGVDIGKPLPPGHDRRPFLIHDLLTMGTEVTAEEVQQKTPPARRALPPAAPR